MRVLLVEEDLIARERLLTALAKRGYDVVTASDGPSALAQLLRSDEPCVALIEDAVPALDAISLCRKIRASAQKHTVYVILRSKLPLPAMIARGLNAGADDYLPAGCHKTVLHARIRLAERSLRTRDALARQVMYDPLTKLPNRAFVIERLASCVCQAKAEPRHQFTLLLIDIDRFKVVNDSLGHTAGNALIKKIAQRLLRAVRTRPLCSVGDDRRETARVRRDTVARMDGDEFVILLEHVAHAEEGVLVANRINDALSKGFLLNGEEIVVSASIGICSSEGPATDASEILRSANAAMDRAKLLGRARYEVNQPGRATAAVSQLQLENELRRAIERGELEVHYQPIVDLSHLHITSFEALLRWRHPKLGLVPPSSFIPLAEETGLILPMGTAVLRAACEQMKLWNARFSPPATVCVNISPRQFTESGFASQVAAALKETGLHPASLELEITENLTMKDVHRAEQVLQELVHSGVSVSLDDFGTGYSSLSYLLRLPIHTLKIDRSFVSKMEHSSESVSIVQTIIALGHSLGMKVIAEGIETETQLALLRELKCDFGQGYLFAPALDSAKATEMFAKSRLNVQLPDAAVALVATPAVEVENLWPGDASPQPILVSA